MKLSARDTTAFLRRPTPDVPAILIYGNDPMRVALTRQDLVGRIVGTDGEAEMRLSRIVAADLRSDRARLDEAMRAQSFFPGRRVALLEDATDGLASVIGEALTAWQAGDATVVVTAGALAARSALRKLFETDRRAVALALYDAPPSDAEVMELVAATGLRPPDGEGRSALLALARDLPAGDFRQTVGTLALYLLRESRQPSAEDVAAVAPRSTEAEVDVLLAVVAEGKRERIAELTGRLAAQGVGAVTLCIAALRHFRQLHAAASDPGGPSQGMARVRPPVFGSRRDRMISQAESWGRPALEKALSLLLETDLTLRSAGRTAPDAALLERALIRLALMAKARA